MKTRGPETPTGNLSPRHTILSRSALSGAHSCLRKQRGFKDTRRPSESEQPRANLLESVPVVAKKKKKLTAASIVVDSQKKRFFEAVLMVVKDKVLVSVGDIKSA